jgi:hypothetical protein
MKKKTKRQALREAWDALVIAVDEGYKGTRRIVRRSRSVELAKWTREEKKIRDEVLRRARLLADSSTLSLESAKRVIEKDNPPFARCPVCRTLTEPGITMLHGRLYKGFSCTNCGIGPFLDS